MGRSAPPRHWGVIRPGVALITVATWNVLHRIHAENWGEEATRRRPDESARIAAITARLAERTERVVALQEVSGDQLADLRGAGMPDRTIHVLRYPRVPTPRRGPSRLADPAEYLVLLVRGRGRQSAAHVFEEDPGKGFLAVDTAGVLVVTTHLSFGPPRVRQLARLAELASDAVSPVILLGDFNADSHTVADGLGPGFSIAALPSGALPTRPAGPSSAPRHIDHVAVHGADIDEAVVEDVDGLSDHNLLRATVIEPTDRVRSSRVTR
ncbi:endonuclease/exonuclease/phosphatase family protein [Embleya scabrispora]|uniref:endonuclease/exonuclease/phosphatase family protein n=1 Tax=Embleya scabrispora TaxID=159449 RepID=UPI001964278B|nr:endonuclease/exonuclease/phosphatase family protein [Embleya scabrispora]